MVDPRQKGARAETAIRDKLRELTGLQWERTPGSGALDAKHLLKGDLYIPGKDNVYCVECKHYAEDQLTSSVLSSKNPTLLDWWKQTIRQAKQLNKKPLLIFKHDRSKLFVAYSEMPDNGIDNVFVDVGIHSFYVSLFEDWIREEHPIFVL